MIANHEINSSIIYEDDKVMAFLDLSQVTKGHTLVIPKKHYENILECESEDLAHVIKVTQMLSKRIVERLDAKGVNILNNCNEAAGQTVMHFHVHVIPRYSDDDSLKLEFNQNLENLNLPAIANDLSKRV
jgi:histidine triad (HIT) family protein